MLIAPLFAADPAAAPANKSFRVYIGTYTSPTGSKGIYRCEFDAATGRLTEPKPAAEIVNPTFLAVHPTQKMLYAIAETNRFEGAPGGGIVGYSIDSATGDLKLSKKLPTLGGPCHLAIHPRGLSVLVANYASASENIFGLDPGTTELTELGQQYQTHTGSSINKQRQESPHSHCATFDPAGKFAFVCDLGTDQIRTIACNADGPDFTLHVDNPVTPIAPGSGPRHLAFAPDGKHAYVICELSNTIVTFDYDAELGKLTPTQTITTLPDGWKGDGGTAEIVVHPNGRFVYGSNRGHDSIAIFTVDAKTGQLAAAGHATAGIKWPRHFTLDPTGRWLLVANQYGNDVIVFAVDEKTGALTATDSRIKVPAPVCVVFTPMP